MLYLEFLAARCRANSVLAARFDLKVFFTVVGKPVQGVAAADVLGFITAQRTGARSLPDPLPEPLLATVSTAGCPCGQFGAACPRSPGCARS